MEQIGFGGSCHWCTEAIFLSLNGVTEVQQGWISSKKKYESLSEAVIIKYDAEKISLETLVSIHLYTHSATSNHSMRSKYRSAIYTFNLKQEDLSREAISKLQAEFDLPIITLVIPFVAFKLNKEEYLNYYYSDPTKAFCQNIVNPKLKILLERFSKSVNYNKVSPNILY